MSAERSLLAYLTPLITDRVEDAAVEALGYILSQSPASLRALNETLQMGTVEVTSAYRVRTQVSGEDGSRPDLVGFDDEGEERLLIEAKFWAGLTDNQPNVYLDRLPASGPSALLFIAPEARLESLWGELTKRVDVSGIELIHGTSTHGMRTVRIDGCGRHLMLTSWSLLLSRMLSNAGTAGESSVEMDIHQLQGLVERMDEDAFLPLRSEELGPEVPHRILNIRRLVDDVTERGCQSSWMTTDGLRVVPQVCGYGRYIQLFDVIIWFGIHFDLWAPPCGCGPMTMMSPGLKKSARSWICRTTYISFRLICRWGSNTKQSLLR